MSVPLLVLVYTRGGYVYIVIPEHCHTVHHALGEFVLEEGDHLVKSPVGEPVDQLGLAALRVPHHHH